MFLRRQSKSKELADLLGNKGSWFVIGGFRSVLCVSVLKGTLLLNFSILSRFFFFFEKRNKFYLSYKFFLFFNMASLDFQGEILPIELPNPEETQIREGESESVRSRQHLHLQLLLVYIAAFFDKQWMLR